MDKNKIEISKDILAELLRQEQKLRLLEYGGVYDWEGYEDSLNPYNCITYDDVQNMSDDEVIDKYL